MVADPAGNRYLGVQLTVKAKVLEDTALGNRFWLGYRLARQHLDYPEQHVAKISVTLDTGVAKQDASGRFVIPENANRIERLEIIWAGDENLPTRKTMVWGDTSLPWGALAALGGAAGAAWLWLRKRRSKTRKKDKKEETRPRITSPLDLTIQVCGREITLTASSEPPGREDEIEWEVPLDQSQSTKSGCGKSFTVQWSETGVKQVVARLGDLRDDVILYLYRTKSGSGTIGDLLGVVVPTAKRTERDYTWHRGHKLPPDVEA